MNRIKRISSCRRALTLLVVGMALAPSPASAQDLLQALGNSGSIDFTTATVVVN